jgi:hypothetical protein
VKSWRGANISGWTGSGIFIGSTTCFFTFGFSTFFKIISGSASLSLSLKASKISALV